MDSFPLGDWQDTLWSSPVEQRAEEDSQLLSLESTPYIFTTTAQAPSPQCSAPLLSPPGFNLGSCHHTQHVFSVSRWAGICAEKSNFGVGSWASNAASGPQFLISHWASLGKAYVDRDPPALPCPFPPASVGTSGL